MSPHGPQGKSRNKRGGSGEQTDGGRHRAFKSAPRGKARTPPCKRLKTSPRDVLIVALPARTASLAGNIFSLHPFARVLGAWCSLGARARVAVT